MGAPPGGSHNPESGRSTNPLGGKIHPSRSNEPTRRAWSGFVERIRRCPACGWENEGHARFCVSCAASIADVEATPSQDPRAGARALQRRLELENRQIRRRRPVQVNGSGGLIAFGALVLTVSLFIQSNDAVRTLAWLVSVGSALGGIWQIRFDEQAMRRWGMFLTACVMLSLGFVGYRALAADDTPTSSLLLTSTPTEPVITRAASTPALSAGFTQSIPQDGVNTAHDGVMPGPPPATSPSLAWQADTVGEVLGAPVLANGTVYATTKTGNLLAIDAASGKTLWQQPVTTYVLRAAPAVIDGVVYVGGGFNFMAFDARSGEKRWSIPLQYGGHASPTVDQNRVIVSSQQGWMYALDSRDGKTLWRVPTEGIVFTSVAVSGNHTVYGTDEGILYNVSAANGKVTWRVRLDGAIYATPVISGDRVFVSTQSGQSMALDLETGDIAWTTNHGSDQPVAVRENTVVLAGSDGGLYGLEASTGEQLWLYPSGKKQLTAPVISGDYALVGAGNSLLAIGLSSGQPAWYYLAGDVVVSSPIVANGYVWFGSRDGFLNAVTVESP